MTQENLMISIDVLRKEVKVLTSRLEPAGTGDLITAIDVINSRIEELIEEVTAPYWKDEDGDIGRLPGQTRSSHLRSIESALEEDVYDGFEEHTKAMESSRLREIQNKAAGRPNMTEKDREKFDSQPNEVRDAYLYSSRAKDDYEHTDEYYDRNRNKPYAEGLSDRSQFLQTMKQKHGQAVMTTSEMMQEELEPLPINTFE